LNTNNKSNIRNLLFATACLATAAGCAQAKKEAPAQIPNIVVIYADDLGYGDVDAYGATRLKTPNIDMLANGGVRFTNGYATSATCTPSRYALLTGQYPWRNEEAKILPGSAPLIIDTAQVTLPRMLKEKGYTTGIVGKWHLGLGNGMVDWNQRVSPGPNEVGFEYAYIMAATQDRTPTVFLENGFVEGLEKDDPLFVDYEKNFEGEPTGLDNPELSTMMWHHGPVLNDGYYDDAVENLGDHTPSGPLRGGKYSLFEAGTRVPFIAYWKGTIKPTVSDALVSHLDLFSSLAKLAGSEATVPDSHELLEVLMGTSDQGREELILEASSRTALHKGDWVMIPPYNGPAVHKAVNIELGNSVEYQLYNLKEDLGQQNNLAESEPEKLQEMITSFEGLRGSGPEKIQQLELK